MKQLILFDVDGTILYPGTLARQLMNEVVAGFTGRSPDLKIEDVAGFTDPIIIRNALKKVQFGRANLASAVETVLGEYVGRLKKEYPTYDQPYLYEDAVELIRECRGAGWRMGLLTGNLREGAEIKLDRFNIWDKFDFGVF
ncbi:MAG: HAD family hydrolase, partial [Fidelibacterota bacterium]